MTRPIPMDPEEREWFLRDPDAYEAVERLHDACDELTAAANQEVDAIGMCFSARHEPLFEGKSSPECVAAAHERSQQAVGEWSAAVESARSLLADRDGD